MFGVHGTGSGNWMIVSRRHTQSICRKGLIDKRLNILVGKGVYENILPARGYAAHKLTVIKAISLQSGIIFCG
jgi:hypothetical protein